MDLDDECIRDIADVITAETPDGIVGAMGASAHRMDGNHVDFVQPRGAVLTSANADKFYSDHMPEERKQ